MLKVTSLNFSHGNPIITAEKKQSLNISSKSMKCGNYSKTTTRSKSKSKPDDVTVQTMNTKTPNKDLMTMTDNNNINDNDDNEIKKCKNTKNKRGDMSVSVKKVKAKRIHECKVCKKVFYCNSKLIRHRKIHTGERTQACDICGKTYPERHQVLRHARIVHQKVRFKCKHCDKAFRAKFCLKTHIATVHNGEYPYKCVECGKTFIDRKAYMRHLGDRITDLRDCHLCYSSFPLYCQFNEHLLTHGPESLQCEICGKIFSDRSSVLRHKKYHAKPKAIEAEAIPCDRCGKYISPNRMNTHLKLHKLEGTQEISSQKLLCDVCGRWIARDGMKKHMKRSHTSPGTWEHKCSICEKRFPDRGSLSAHITFFHKRDKKYPCLLCEKTFMNNNQLKCHMRSQSHTGERPFQCQICSVSFTQKSHLTRHVRIHTGERFRCHLCDASFVEKYLLPVHIRIAHTTNNSSNTAEKDGESFPCLVCDEHCFKNARLRNKHMEAVHKTDGGRYSCRVCDKTFPRPRSLELHLRAHSGERPFKCEHCFKCFFLKNHMKVHIRAQHEGFKYKCEQCGKEYSTAFYFKRHILKAHGNDDNDTNIGHDISEENNTKE